MPGVISETVPTFARVNVKKLLEWRAGARPAEGVWFGESNAEFCGDRMLTKHRDPGHIDRDLDSVTSSNRDAPRFSFMTNMPWTSGNAQISLEISRSPAFSFGVICVTHSLTYMRKIQSRWNTLKAGLRPRLSENKSRMFSERRIFCSAVSSNGFYNVEYAAYFFRLE